eukprot:scaffold15972_cov73-Cyclotella_meneghiniana.AAC.6
MEGRFYYLYHSLKQKGIHGKGLKSMLITDARARILSKINACRLVIVSLTGKIFLLNETCEPLDRGTNNFVTPAIHTSNESSPLGQVITEMANFGRPSSSKTSRPILTNPRRMRFITRPTDYRDE